MYWVLICAPLIIELILSIHSLIIKPLVYSSIINYSIWIWVLLGRQIYLLLINYIYIKRHTITYAIGLLSAIFVICLSVGNILILHKIKYGVFIGDVPEGIYYLLMCIPIIVVLIGMAIMYFFRK